MLCALLPHLGDEFQIFIFAFSIAGLLPKTNLAIPTVRIEVWWAFCLRGNPSAPPPPAWRRPQSSSHPATHESPQQATAHRDGIAALKFPGPLPRSPPRTMPWVSFRYPSNPKRTRTRSRARGQWPLRLFNWNRGNERQHMPPPPP